MPHAKNKVVRQLATAREACPAPGCESHDVVHLVSHAAAGTEHVDQDCLTCGANRSRFSRLARLEWEA